MAEPEGGGKPKKGLGKYKWWIVGGGVIVAAILFVAIRSANKNNSAASNTAATTAQNSGINPATGYLYGSPADQAASAQQGLTSVGTPGPAGPAGPTGPAGPAGPSGPTGKPGTVSTVPIQVPPPKTGGKLPVSRTYVVKSGDNLTKIASSLGLPNWQTLYNENRTLIGGNPNLIHPGQRLKY